MIGPTDLLQTCTRTKCNCKS